MNLIDMSFKKRYEMMRKRYAFISETLKGYSSLQQYATDKEEWYAIRGIALSDCEDYITLCNYISYNDYETYNVIPTPDGSLAVSHIIWWQHPFCYNEIINIFTGETAEEEDILLYY